MDARDRIILDHAPLAPMPRFGGLSELEQNHHRFITAESGLFLEVRRAWLQVIVRIAECRAPLPYGPLAESFDYAFDDAAMQAVLDQFTADAGRAMPNECAAWAVWNERTGQLEYRPLIADEASPGGITFHRPRLAPHESLAIDMHSHGAMGAFFSGTDDSDDCGEVKVAVVVGTLDRAPSYSIRLCLLGHFVEGEEED